MQLSEMRADREVVLEAVQHDVLARPPYVEWDMTVKPEAYVPPPILPECALQYAALELRADQEVVQEAVRRNWGAIAHAAEGIVVDREVLIEAVLSSGYRAAELMCLIQQRSPTAAAQLCADRETMMQVVRHVPVLRLVAEELRSDRELVLEAVNGFGQSLADASEEMKADREIVLQAVRRDCRALEYASMELKADREVVVEALRSRRPHWQHWYTPLDDASAELRADPEIVFEDMRRHWTLYGDTAAPSIPYCHHRIPLLVEPDSIHTAIRNPFAAQGTCGTVCNVVQLEVQSDGTVKYEALIGMGGFMLRGQLRSDMPILELGSALKQGDYFIHMVMPGHGAPVSPLDACRPLSQYLQ